MSTGRHRRLNLPEIAAPAPSDEVLEFHRLAQRLYVMTAFLERNEPQSPALPLLRRTIGRDCPYAGFTYGVAAR